MEYITVKEKRVPVTADVDVFIAGGGCAGVGAAIQAARSGAKVYLAERLFCLGGTASAGLMSKVAYVGKEYPLSYEIAERIDAYQGTHFHEKKREVPIDPEAVKYVLDRMVIDESGVSVHFGTVVNSVVTDGRRIQAVILGNLDGETAVRAKYYIDCTGDGQLAYLSGAQCMAEGGGSYSSSPTLMFRIGNVDLEALFRYEEENPELFEHVYHTYAHHIMSPETCRQNIKNQAYAHMADFVKLIRTRCAEHPGMFTAEEQEILLRRGLLFLNQPAPGHVLVNSTTRPEFTGTSERELSTTVQDMRRQCHVMVRFAKAFIPGFEKAYLMDTASMPGIRESRRIRGDYVLTQEDVEKGHKFEDRITSNCGVVELHSGKENSLKLGTSKGIYDIPYRCIIAADFDNLFMAGRCFSATHAALSAARNIGYCCALGQAAGAAAAVLSREGKENVREIDVNEVRKVMTAEDCSGDFEGMESAGK